MHTMMLTHDVDQGGTRPLLPCPASSSSSTSPSRSITSPQACLYVNRHHSTHYDVLTTAHHRLMHCRHPDTQTHTCLLACSWAAQQQPQMN
jgi:hypothetical protein